MDDQRDPASSSTELSTDGSPGSERDSPQSAVSYPQVDDQVSQAEEFGQADDGPADGSLVSRETATHLVDVLLEGAQAPDPTASQMAGGRHAVVDPYEALLGSGQHGHVGQTPGLQTEEETFTPLSTTVGELVEERSPSKHLHSGRDSESASAAPPASGDDLLPMNDDRPSSAPVSRGTGVRTAADIAESGRTPYDDSTPLARAAEHVVRARHGQLGLDGPGRPPKTRVMVVANQKGGVGKTTSTVNLAAALAQLGQRVLVIDLDPQGNASTALNIEHRRGVPSTYDLLVDDAKLEEVSTPSPDLPNLHVVPATIDLAGAEIELVSVVARESRLDKAIKGHPLVGSADDVGESRLDYVFVDCPPSLGLLTLNALVAAEEMVIPIQAEYYALEGLGQLLETVEMVRAHLNQRLKVSTILMTMYDARTRLAANVASEVREHFGDTVLKTMVPRSVRVSEAPSYSQTVMTYDPASPGALSYLEAAREIAIKGAPKS